MCSQPSALLTVLLALASHPGGVGREETKVLYRISHKRAYSQAALAGLFLCLCENGISHGFKKV